MVVSRVVCRSLAGALVLFGIEAAAACVLADPPADIPVPPVVPPQIVRVAVQPPITEFLDTIPGSFSAPVAVDPRQQNLGWQFFVDGAGQGSRSQEDVDGGPLLIVDIDDITPPLDPDACHVLELVVYYPDAPDVPGDSVTWFYSRTLSFDGCQVFDAGPPDAGPEAAADGGD